MTRAVRGAESAVRDQVELVAAAATGRRTEVSSSRSILRITPVASTSHDSEEVAISSEKGKERAVSPIAVSGRVASSPEPLQTARSACNDGEPDAGPSTHPQLRSRSPSPLTELSDSDSDSDLTLARRTGVRSVQNGLLRANSTIDVRCVLFLSPPHRLNACAGNRLSREART